MQLRRVLPLSVLALSSAAAQLAPANRAGVTLGHIQLTVKDSEAQTRFWTERMGGVAVEKDMIRFPGVYIVLRQGESAGPPAGSIVNHFGFVYKDLALWMANWKANGIEIEQTGNPIQGYVHAPDGVRVEFFGDPSIDAPVKMDHIHFYPTETSEIKAWYAKAFGGQPGQRPRVSTPGWIDCDFFPGANFSFSKQDTQAAPTVGRSLDHIGFEVKNLNAFVKKLAGQGVRIDKGVDRSPGRERPENGLVNGSLGDANRADGGPGARDEMKMLRAVNLFVVVALTSQLLAQDARLEHARAVNLERAAHLPSFEADEIMVRYQSPRVDPPRWKKVDTIESAIAFRGGDFTREHTTVNGKPWNKPQLPNGSHPRIGFGFEIKPLFDPACRADIQYVGTEEIQGRPASTYGFRTAPDGCFGSLGLKNGTLSALKLANPPRVGRFTIDEPGGNMIHFEMEAIERPRWLDPSKEIDTWDYVKVGDNSWLLPVAYENYSGGGNSGLWHVVVEYKNHRHFESSTSVTFK